MRRILSALGIALGALRAAKLRSTLTALGILIGVAAVVVVTALGTGAAERVGGQLESLGSNLLFVWGMPTTKSGARVKKEAGLTDGDALAMRREATAIAEVSVYTEMRPQVVSEFGNAKISVMGVDAAYFSVRNYEVESGRRWTEQEERFKSKVILIGHTAISKLYGNVDPIGHYLRVGRHAFRIVGVLTPKGQSAFEDQDDRVLMPIGTWRSRLQPSLGTRVHLIVATAKSAAHVPEAERQMTAILRQRHSIAEGQEDDFRVRTQEQFRESQQAILTVLTTLLLSVAGISLTVGGVGVMNIMLVSVAERTREIGTRMAIGARRRDIELQFLLEAVTLTVFGGISGILLATGVVALMIKTLEWSMRISAGAVAVALLTSAAVGLLFGFLPAQRAAALDPAEALRHE